MMEPEIHQFGEHDLQNVLVWMPPQQRAAEYLFWIVLIHGGAWRDPMITARTFADPVVSKLLSNPAADLKIPGNKTVAIASLSYRLSAHPSYPQDPDASPRNAIHPDHLDDVCTGIDVLRRVYGLSSNNYVLVGHSCGATLAFQAWKRHIDTGFPVAPGALVGLAGIYDIKALLRNHSTGPFADIYESFIRGAFGDDEKVWVEASPSRFALHGMDFPRTILLAVADRDELVEPEQRTIMKGTLLGNETLESMKSDIGNGNVRYSEVSVPGGHDEMWEKGENMVLVVDRLLNVLSGE